MELTQEYFDQKLNGLATKDDLKNFATKDDLKNFATKEDLQNFATKDDLQNFATKDDLSGLTTKEDLKAALATQTQELKQFAIEQTEELARIIAGTVAEPMQQHFDELHSDMDVKAEVQELKRDMLKIKTALHLTT